LSTTRISKNFGGRQAKMRDSKLTVKEFGPYHSAHHMLQPGMYQRMIFNAEDIGPFYLSEAERRDRLYDKPSGKKVSKDYRKDELIVALERDGMKVSKGLTRKKCEKLCKDRGIATTYMIDVIIEGWIGKPKGSFQILFERGWIDPSNISAYTQNGTKDAMGNVLEYTSLKKLLEKQQDFASELTLLQYHAQLLGAIVDRTPKCHPELAGEGIEYAWALAKLFYRRQRLELKRSKDTFLKLVRRCTSTEDVLSVDQVRKCSRRAREYMLAYKSFEVLGNRNENGDANFFGEHVVTLNYKLIEKSIKTYKTHRNCLDTDTKWLRKMLKEMGQEQFNIVKCVVKRMDLLKCEITIN